MRVTRNPNRGVELGYAEITSAISTTNTSPTYADATGLTVTVTVGARPILIEAWFPYVYHSAATQGVQVNIMESTTVLAYALPVGSAASEAQGGVTVRKRLAPSAGSHTYKVGYAGSGAGTSNIFATSTSPALLTVIEV